MKTPVYVRRTRRAFEAVRAIRTARGPRQAFVLYLGSHPACWTLEGARDHWRRAAARMLPRVRALARSLARIEDAESPAYRVALARLLAAKSARRRVLDRVAAIARLLS